MFAFVSSSGRMVARRLALATYSKWRCVRPQGGTARRITRVAERKPLARGFPDSAAACVQARQLAGRYRIQRRRQPGWWSPKTASSRWYLLLLVTADPGDVAVRASTGSGQCLGVDLGVRLATKGDRDQ